LGHCAGQVLYQPTEPDDSSVDLLLKRRTGLKVDLLLKRRTGLKVDLLLKRRTGLTNRL